MEDLENNGGLPKIEKLQVYQIRWLILAIFVMFSASNAMQWIQYSIIADVICDYYNISTNWVDWTSMIYMILYIPFIFPGSYLLDKLVSAQRFILTILIIENYIQSFNLFVFKQLIILKNR